MQRSIASVISAVIFLLSPGLGPYEAFARPIAAVRPAAIPSVSPPVLPQIPKKADGRNQVLDALQLSAQAAHLPRPVETPIPAVFPSQASPMSSNFSIEPVAPLPAPGVQVRAAYEQVSRQVGQVSREVGGISNQINQVLGSAGPIAQAGTGRAATLGVDLQAILSEEPTRRRADGRDFSVGGIWAQARGARESDQGRSLARPAGKDIQVAVDTYRGDAPTLPPIPPGPSRSTAAEDPGGTGGPFWAKLVAGALAFLPAYFLGIPLAQNGLALEHGIFMHAALAMGLVPFLGASPWKWLVRVPILRRIGPRSWSVIRALPGILLFSLGATVSLAATGWMGIIAGVWTMLGGWALGKFLLGSRESSKDSAYLHVKRWGAYFSALYVLSGAGLAALYLPGLEPGLLMWLINPLTAFLFHYLPVRSWKFWCSLLLVALLSVVPVRSGNPVLASLAPVVASRNRVSIDEARIREVAAVLDKTRLTPSN